MTKPVIVHKHPEESLAMPPITLTDDCGGIDLTSAKSLHLTMNGVDRIYWWIDRAAGIVGIQPPPDAVGVYNYEFEIVWDDGMTQHVPNTGPLAVEIHQELPL